jgi:hypothetical protein
MLPHLLVSPDAGNEIRHESFFSCIYYVPRIVVSSVIGHSSLNPEQDKRFVFNPEQALFRYILFGLVN